MKVYRDGDTDLPTICGTGLEDYVGSAWGMGALPRRVLRARRCVVQPGDAARRAARRATPTSSASTAGTCPTRSCSTSDLRVTIQQIGAKFFAAGQEAALEAYEQTNPVAGEGWHARPRPGMLAWGIAERVDDYCATAYVYCTEAQAVPRVDVAAATADIDAARLRDRGPVRALRRHGRRRAGVTVSPRAARRRRGRARGGCGAPPS